MQMNNLLGEATKQNQFSNKVCLSIPCHVYLVDSNWEFLYLFVM